jgi:hypothetical protein
MGQPWRCSDGGDDTPPLRLDLTAANSDIVAHAAVM